MDLETRISLHFIYTIQHVHMKSYRREKVKSDMQPALTRAFTVYMQRDDFLTWTLVICTPVSGINDDGARFGTRDFNQRTTIGTISGYFANQIMPTVRVIELLSLGVNGESLDPSCICKTRFHFHSIGTRTCLTNRLTVAYIAFSQNHS